MLVPSGGYFLTKLPEQAARGVASMFVWVKPIFSQKWQKSLKLWHILKACHKNSQDMGSTTFDQKPLGRMTFGKDLTVHQMTVMTVSARHCVRQMSLGQVSVGQVFFRLKDAAPRHWSFLITKLKVKNRRIKKLFFSNFFFKNAFFSQISKLYYMTVQWFIMGTVDSNLWPWHEEENVLPLCYRANHYIYLSMCFDREEKSLNGTAQLYIIQK